MRDFSTVLIFSSYNCNPNAMNIISDLQLRGDVLFAYHLLLAKPQLMPPAPSCTTQDQSYTCGSMFDCHLKCDCIFVLIWG